MTVKTVILFSVFVFPCISSKLQFPPGFRFGASTSAYQVEGAWNISGKGESIYDQWAHSTPSPVMDGSTGDVACDSYHLWQRDIDMVHELGLHFYRFSISWPRILPSGFSNKINKDGVDYYNKLINGLLQKGIEPVVTMYHFDLPKKLQDLGGWTNPLITDWFADYARVLYSLFADRVNTWITINEPLIFCDLVYNTGVLAPNILEQDLAPFICNKNVLMAHAKAWRIYDEEYKKKYKGKVSIAVNPVWIEPATEADEDLAILAREFGAGRYSHAIYSEEGGWPPLVEKYMAAQSKREGYSFSKLPAFTEEEKKLVRGTYDYYSLNHYTTRLIREAAHGEKPGPWLFEGSRELNAILFNDPSWSVSKAQSLGVVPYGIRRQIAWLHQHYGNVSIFISENGFPSNEGLADCDKVQFLHDYLEQVLLAIKEDGANVIAYTVWALMDNFEWANGYIYAKYGLYSVDFDDHQRTRTPRDSARFFADVVQKHALLPAHKYCSLSTGYGQEVLNK